MKVEQQCNVHAVETRRKRGRGVDIFNLDIERNVFSFAQVFDIQHPPPSLLVTGVPPKYEHF